MGNGSAVGAVTARAVDKTTEDTSGFARRAFERWKKAAHAIGVVQTRFLMFAMFVVMVLPTGLLMRLFRDPLQLRPPGSGNWSPTKQEKPTLETARRQF
jgi:NAD dependent epimerase/dehydratase family enzyme